jgi:hypothetical protein
MAIDRVAEPDNYFIPNMKILYFPYSWVQLLALVDEESSRVPSSNIKFLNTNAA